MSCRSMPIVNSNSIVGTNLRVAQWDQLPEGWCLTGNMAAGLFADNVREPAL